MKVDPKTVAADSGHGYKSNRGGPCFLPHMSSLDAQLSCHSILSSALPCLLTFNLGPRVQVVMMEPSRKEPLYLGEWHMFLPGDVTLVQNMLCAHCVTLKILFCNFQQTVCCNSLFHQDQLNVSI